MIPWPSPKESPSTNSRIGVTFAAAVRLPEESVLIPQKWALVSIRTRLVALAEGLPNVNSIYSFAPLEEII